MKNIIYFSHSTYNTSEQSDPCYNRSAFAQFAIGPKVGLNISKERLGEKPIDEDVEFITGLNIGMFGRYKISNGLDIQTEL